MRLSRLLILVGVVASVASPLAAASQNLGGDPSNGDLPPALVASASGAATAVTGADRGGLRLRRARSGRGFGPGRLLTVKGESPVLAAGGSGLVAFAFLRPDGSHIADPEERDEDCCLRLFAGVLDRAGRTRRVRRLSAPGDSAQSAVIAARGTRVAASWVDPDGLKVSRGTARTGFEPAQTLSNHLYPLAVIASTHPHVFATEAIRTGNTVQERWRAAGRTHRRNLGRFRAAISAHVASPAGHLLLVGRDLIRRFSSVALVGWRRPGGRLTITRAPSGGPAGEDVFAAALAPDGRGLVATPGPRRRVRTREVSGSGHVGWPHDVPLPPGETAIDVAVARNASGAGVLAAESQDRKGRRRIYAWRLGTLGHAGPRSTLRGPRSTYEYDYGLTATVDARGGARVAWNDGRIRAVRLP